MAYEYTHEYLKECGDAVRRGDVDGAVNALQPHLPRMRHGATPEIRRDIGYALYGRTSIGSGTSYDDGDTYDDKLPDFVTVALVVESSRELARMAAFPVVFFTGGCDPLFRDVAGLTRLAAADVAASGASSFLDAAGLFAFRAVSESAVSSSLGMDEDDCHPLHACGYAMSWQRGFPSPPIPVSGLLAVLNTPLSLDKELARHVALWRAPMRELAVQAGDAALVASLDTVDATLRGEKGLRAYVDMLSPSHRPDISVVQLLVSADPAEAFAVLDALITAHTPADPDRVRLDITLPGITAMLVQDPSPEMTAYARKTALPAFIDAAKQDLNRRGDVPHADALVDLVTHPAMKGVRLPIAIVRALSDEQRARLDTAGVKYRSSAGVSR